jgi:cadmium resistance protein CadD (predicted permease)
VTASLLATAFVAFAGTTIDDLVVLAALFTTNRASGRPNTATIVGGQYAGFAAIVALALLAARGLQVIPEQWIGLLGLVPIGFGLWGLARAWAGDRDDKPPMASTFPQVVAITFANGADNIGVFTPLFRSMELAGSLAIAAVFLCLIGVWCGIGRVLGTHRAVAGTIGRVSHWLVPAIFITVGASIVVTSGTLTHLGIIS